MKLPCRQSHFFDLAHQSIDTMTIAGLGATVKFVSACHGAVRSASVRNAPHVLGTHRAARCSMRGRSRRRSAETPAQSTRRCEASRTGALRMLGNARQSGSESC